MPSSIDIVNLKILKAIRVSQCKFDGANLDDYCYTCVRKGARISGFQSVKMCDGRVNTVENSAVLTEQDDHRNERSRTSAAASEDRGENFEVRAHESRENLLLTEHNKPQYSFKNTNYIQKIALIAF